MKIPLTSLGMKCEKNVKQAECEQLFLVVEESIMKRIMVDSLKTQTSAGIPYKKIRIMAEELSKKSYSYLAYNLLF